MKRTAPWTIRAVVPLTLALASVAALAPTAARPAAAAAPAITVTTERHGGADRYATAVAISKRLFPAGGAAVVYLASGETFPDALVAGPLATRNGGVVLLTTHDTLPAVVEAELIRLAPAKVIAVGGTAVVSPNVTMRVRAVLGPATAVSRIQGADRYATTAALSASGWDPGEAATVFVATGADFPDALAAASVAAGQGVPVLLTRGDGLPRATATELRRLDPARVVIVGGTAAVSAGVASAIAALGPSVSRVSGRDRYSTAVAVANKFLPDTKTVVTATGLTFPDALAAVPLAASLGAPLLLVLPDVVPVATRDAVRARKPTTIVVAGGPGAVWAITLGELVGWSDGRLTVPPKGPTYPTFDSRYHDYGEMVTFIKAAEIAFPDLVHVFSIGKSYAGREIWAAKVSDNVAVDENEPEVLVDALHHAREHLTVEQGLYLFRTLLQDYATDKTVHRLVDSREVWFVFALNPDGWAYDLTGGPYVGWRKNRQPNPGSSAIGTDLNRNYGYHFACCGGSSGSASDWNYHGPAAWSAVETRRLRDFVLSRVIGGKQQIRTHVTLHTNGELILWPYGYTKTDIPKDMTVDDHATFVAMARAMAAKNGYVAKQSSDLYVTDGDQIDWMYGTQHIFSFTFELYPTEQVSSHRDHEPPDEVIAKQTARNRSALLYLIDKAACPYAAIGKAGAYC